jgi:hypothetical protein
MLTMAMMMVMVMMLMLMVTMVRSYDGWIFEDSFLFPLTCKYVRSLG